MRPQGPTLLIGRNLRRESERTLAMQMPDDGAAGGEITLRMSRIEVIDIHKSFGKYEALKGISLQVEQGEIVGFFGPDGAGKTVTFQCILGLQRPNSGRIVFDGADVTHLPFYRRAILGLGYLPEQQSVFRGLTVSQNVMAMLEISEPSREQRAERLEELLRSLRLSHLRDAMATSLSGGERRRCEVARALALEPVIMLLDEPFRGIDPLTIASIKELIFAMRARGIGVLITDQNVPEMLDIVDRAYVIDNGRVIFEGEPDAMVSDPEVIAHYLGPDD